MAVLEESQDELQFISYHPMEIVQILKDLAKHKEPLTASFNHGTEEYLTMVIGVNYDRKAVYLDMGLDTGFNRRLLASDSVIFAKNDGVKIRWTSKKLSVVKLKDGQAIKIPLPKSIYRLQRREYFRSPAPMVNPVVCHIPYINSTNNEQEEVALNIIDASLGGIGAVANEHLPPAFLVGQSFKDCKINLTDIGEVTVSLNLRYSTETTLRNGATKYRVGFAFVDMPGSEQRLIQRFVTNLEREAMIAATDT